MTVISLKTNSNAVEAAINETNKLNTNKLIVDKSETLVSVKANQETKKVVINTMENKTIG